MIHEGNWQSFAMLSISHTIMKRNSKKLIPNAKCSRNSGFQFQFPSWLQSVCFSFFEIVQIDGNAPIDVYLLKSWYACFKQSGVCDERAFWS